MIEYYNVLLIGLGNISQLYDYKTENEQTFSHAKAYHENKFFKLIGGIDPKKENRDLFYEKYRCMSFEKIEEAQTSIKPDLIVIASPTADHLVSIRKSLEFWNPKIIVCEKPLSYSLEMSKQIIKICETNEVKLFVNYPRISLFDTIFIKKQIFEDLYVSPFQGTVWYSKSLFSGGIHFLNLMINFFGKVKDVHILDNDYCISNKFEFAPSFRIKFKKGIVSFISLSKQNIYLNEFKLIFNNGYLDYKNAGMNLEWFDANENEMTFSHDSIVSNSKIIKTDFLNLQKYHVEELKKFIKFKKANLCDSKLAFDTEEALDMIYKICSVS